MSYDEPLHEAVSDASDPIAVIERILRRCLSLVERAEGVSLEIRRTPDTVEFLAAVGSIESFVGHQIRADSSLTGLAISTGEIQFTDDARKDPRVEHTHIKQAGVMSVLCVPLHHGEAGRAVLTVVSARPRAFGDADVVIMRGLIGPLQAALAAASTLALLTADAVTGAQDDDAEYARRAALHVRQALTHGEVYEQEAAERIQGILASGRVSILIQPIVSLVSGELVSVEALARFPVQPVRSPDKWFAEARHMGLGVELELLAVMRALSLLKSLPSRVGLSVNVSPETAVDPMLRTVLADVQRDRLTLELTDRSRVSDAELLEALAGLRSSGVRLAVNDDGSGLAGLAQLDRLRPDTIKLGLMLTSGIHEDPARQAAVAALVALAERSGARIIAEGIESEDEAAALLDLGVEYGQGFHFGRPMPAEQLAAAGQ